ncbi:hypothetical protein SLEP1_g40669 [Rubroshorea leprosula]|uniref:BZIP domain-containing protein n=1 Tax=Rubroshorea leprosula TaxID=152421 RepID=A0AAV5L480_9ROSI|nr:hypothetical protein SLEP1_g40669 [Rubroshorea leprosula]
MQGVNVWKNAGNTCLKTVTPRLEDLLLLNINDQLDHGPDDLTENFLPRNHINEGNQDEAGDETGKIRSNCKDQGSQNGPREDGLPIILEFPELTPTPIHEGSQAAPRTEVLVNQTGAGIEQQLGQPAAVPTVDSLSTRNMGEMSAEAQKRAKRLARKRECDRNYRQRKKVYKCKYLHYHYIFSGSTILWVWVYLFFRPL